MANLWLNVYKDNPTEGGTDGVLVSENGEMTSPVDVTLNAAQNESKTIKLALRCRDGYKTDGAATIQDDGDLNDRWKFSTSQDGVFSDVITIANDITTVNTVFWARIDSDSSENPSISTNVKIKVTAPVLPV